MTPFMLRVREVIDGDPAPQPRAEPSAPLPVAAGADRQVLLRSLAEQLVAEANSVLRSEGRFVELSDGTGPGGLFFTLRCGNRTARIDTVVTGGSALARVTAPGIAEDVPCRLTDEHDIEALLLTLIDGQQPTPH